jgi:hypothetical protein
MLTFIQRTADYEELFSNVGAVFDTTARLPNMVFRRAPKRLEFFEFDDVFEAFFWQAIRVIARECRDSEVELLVVEPESANYFKRQFGHYGAAAISVDTDPEEYRQLLSKAPEGSPADALIHNGRILTLTGRSRGFGFWCERELEIGVVALFECLPANPTAALPTTISWKSVDEALALMAPVFLDRRVPPDLAATLRSNYSSSIQP